MKPLHFFLSLVVGFIVIVSIFNIELNNNHPKIDLPEEYKMIDKSTAIIGYFDKDSVLHIEFDNRIQFEWEGLEKDIPEDGIQQLQLATNENTVYLNPVDE